MNNQDLTIFTSNRNNKAWCKVRLADKTDILVLLNQQHQQQWPRYWSWDFCSPQNPCTAGQGDCDINADCKTGLVCAQNVGIKYGQPKGMDVCEKKVEVRPSPSCQQIDQGIKDSYRTKCGDAKYNPVFDLNKDRKVNNIKKN